MEIDKLVARQRKFFATGKTLELKFRHVALSRLKTAIYANEDKINEALYEDLGKSTTETYMCETGMTLSELSFMDKHLDKWARPGRVPTPLAQFHASSYTVKNPYGVVLIMSPWNYPFMLAMEPLVGAIACGNCCIVKPSAYAPATSAIIREIVDECFPPEYVAVVEGGREENKDLLKQEFDYIFFTGGVNVGKEVMRAASKHLTPVTLELGGKSPVIIDKTAKLNLAAKRLAFGKLLNCGQTCVAPDYVLIDESIQDKFIEKLSFYFDKMLGNDPLKNDNYVHMINQKHFDRVCGLIDGKKVVYGGKSDRETLRIEPTIMKNVSLDDKVMQEEIFGPVLPFISFRNINSALRLVNSRPHPLAAYLFSEDRHIQERFLKKITFGGGCINDTIIHLATSQMGFGGVGASGMGSYHGKKSFETFSHEKSIVNKSTWMDMPVRYAPYNCVQERLLKLFLR